MLGANLKWIDSYWYMHYVPNGIYIYNLETYILVATPDHYNARLYVPISQWVFHVGGYLEGFVLFSGRCGDEGVFIRAVLWY